MKSRIFLIVTAIVQVFALKAQEHTSDFNTRIEITYNLKKAGKINTASSEFGAVIQGNELIFASDREYNLVHYGESGWKKRKKMNLFKTGFSSPADDSVTFGKIIPYRDRLPDHYHEGPVCFHPSGQYAIVTRVITQQKTNKPQLYLMKKESGKWQKPEKLAFSRNDFSYGHAAFSEDGQTLYFSSDQEGSKGGKDIFFCSFDKGQTGTPVNAGGNINSEKDEMFPFFQAGKLYFSSDRAGTMGGLDIYRSNLRTDGFEKAENAGGTINSTADDFSFYLTATGRNGFMASNRDGNDEVYFFTVKETAVILSKNITGKFSYTKMRDGFPEGLELQLLDEAGNIVQTTRTDAFGQFQFNNLPADQDFTIRVVELSDDLTLHILSKEGKEVAVLMSDRRGSFVYKKLEQNEVGTLSLMELGDKDLNGVKTGRLSGQFVHEKLKNDPVGGMKIMLVDEAGNVYATAITDKNGNFTFSRLPTDQNFYLMADSPYDDLKLLVYNKNDEVVAELKRRGSGPFIFRRIDSRLENSLTFMDNQDTQLFPSSYMNLEGRFQFGPLSGSPRPLDFVVTDEAGNLLGKGVADARGNFILTGLPPREVYIFKLDEKDAGLAKRGLKLEMLNRYDEQLQMIDGTEAGLYIFDRRPKAVLTGETFAVYFDKDRAELSPESMAALKTYVEKMKADPGLQLQLDGHADASYNDEHNMQLSMRRMLNTKQYFIRNGISSKRIKGYYHGEKQLANGCTDASKCSDQENRANRRCEVRLVLP